jgi:hypothetical protein
MRSLQFHQYAKHRTIQVFLYILPVFFLIASLQASSQQKIVVFQSDFGLQDGAVSAMKGVAMGVSTDLRLFDLTHEIPPYDIWEAAYRLEQTVAYWPAGTVFVSVVDPGVGTDRKPVVLKTRSGHYIVTPDNGTLTLIAGSLGIDSIRLIDEAVNRRSGSAGSYTFHGRDVFAYTAARLASGAIRFGDVGPLQEARVVMIPYQSPVHEGNRVRGNIPILDTRYGNVWTNIPSQLLEAAGIRYGDLLQVRISRGGKDIYQGTAPYVRTFGEVGKGKVLCYLNSLMQLSVALNQDDFAKRFGIGSGGEWRLEITKKP